MPNEVDMESKDKEGWVNTTTDQVWDYSLSDNSHIIGRPIKVWEEIHGLIQAPREEWVGGLAEKVQELLPGIELHVYYG